MANYYIKTVCLIFVLIWTFSQMYLTSLIWLHSKIARSVTSILTKTNLNLWDDSNKIIPICKAIVNYVLDPQICKNS